MTVDKLHFANYFGVFPDPDASLQIGEMAFNSNMQMVYKDGNSVVHLLPSINDYTNIYNPNTIQITQTVKNATVGVGTEGDYSENVGVAIPYSFIITATGIHERQALVQYDQANILKDTLILPEFFCKLGTAADVFDVSQGTITEAISKNKITANMGRQAYTNNATFKIVKVEGTTVDTTLGFPFTTEANRDNASFRDNFYIGADSFVYLIKDISINELTYPFWVFYKRNNPILVRIKTNYFLFEKHDKFSLKTYRTFSDNASTPSQQIIGDTENFLITDILKSSKITVLQTSTEPLTISANGKNIDGLDSLSYYEIIVATNEVKINPTLVYNILDITDGFFSYLYKILKYISNNASGTGSTFTGGSSSSKELAISHVYSVSTEGQLTFPITGGYTPKLLNVYMNGGLLRNNIDYIATDGLNVTLSASVSAGEEFDFEVMNYTTRLPEVLSVNGRTGDIVLVSSDITGALGFTPVDATFVEESTRSYHEKIDVSTWDAATGKYTTVQYIRPEDGSVAITAVLSNKDGSGNYLTDTWTINSSAGATTIRTWTLTYDTNGIIIEKTYLDS
jgi:hypothetical protein